MGKKVARGTDVFPVRAMEAGTVLSIAQGPSRPTGAS
jgi:hypothetical protein